MCEETTKALSKLEGDPPRYINLNSGSHQPSKSPENSPAMGFQLNSLTPREIEGDRVKEREEMSFEN